MPERAPIDEVVIDRHASLSEVVAVEDVFRRAGFDVTVRAEYEARAADLVPWIVSIVVTTPLVAFFASFGSKAGEDAYAAVKQWVRELRQARAESRAPAGSIRVDDPDGSSVVFGPRLPDHAIDALAEVDWTTARGDYLTWDDERGEWRDPTKHARQR